jgi:cyclase
MKTLPRWGMFALAFAGCVLAAVAQSDAPPEMKFNEVKEMAPGVYFRYASISATDPKVPFGGCNQIWILFKEYIVVIDANFPKEAGEVLAAIRKTSRLPIRYVLDTHHHGDHAYGNAVWAKEGAKIVSHIACARLLKTSGPKQWEEQKALRQDLAESTLKQVDVTFDDEFILDDGTQRVEFHFLGHAHTAGDAVAYLPKQRILCTGDACVNGAYNYMGHSDSGSWIRVLEKLEGKFDAKWVFPGHGPIAGKEVLGKQKRYFEELRKQLSQRIGQGKSLEDISGTLEMAWYKEWTGKDANENKENLQHVYDELQGKIDHGRIGMQDSRSGFTPHASPAVTTSLARMTQPETK